tara:strand:- start:3426 stop:3656 length:231 start_codon:yes stop_codon:yes gene_type:complete
MRFAGSMFGDDSLSIPMIGGESGFHVPEEVAMDPYGRQSDRQLLRDLRRGEIGPLSDPNIQRAILNLEQRLLIPKI